MKLRVLITTFAILILSTAVYIASNPNHASSLKVVKSKERPSATAQKLIPTESSLAKSNGLNYQVPQQQLNATIRKVDDSMADKLRDDIDMDLKQIQHRRYVETLNDPRANAAEKEEALKFMGAYLEKLTRYMKIRNQQIQAMMEQNNG
jgi:hypothetical protein